MKYPSKVAVDQDGKTELFNLCAEYVSKNNPQAMQENLESIKKLLQDDEYRAAALEQAVELPQRFMNIRSPKVSFAGYDIGKTPLFIAIENDRPELVELLLSYGANPNVRCYDTGQRAIELIFGRDHYDKMHDIIDNHYLSNINIRSGSFSSISSSSTLSEEEERSIIGRMRSSSISSSTTLSDKEEKSISSRIRSFSTATKNVIEGIKKQFKGYSANTSSISESNLSQSITSKEHSSKSSNSSSRYSGR